MVYVCKELFPMGTYPQQQEDGFYMTELLKVQLDYLIKNIYDDWAFTGIISGSGEVRVGKSVLAMQIACYWISEVNRIYNKNYTFKVPDNFVFNGNELIAQGNHIGTTQPFSCIIYDEAGADIQAVKVMSGTTQEVLDYLRECGQYNMLTLLVLPEFFSLPRGIAMTYSTFLIDVNYTADEAGFFERGHYKFFSRKRKKFLYLHGKKELNYDAGKFNFRGHFHNFHPVDKEKYKELKRQALKKREKPLTKIQKKALLIRDATWYYLYENNMMDYNEIANIYQGIPLPTKITYDVVAKAITIYKDSLIKNSK